MFLNRYSVSGSRGVITKNTTVEAGNISSATKRWKFLHNTRIFCTHYSGTSIGMVNLNIYHYSYAIKTSLDKRTTTVVLTKDTNDQESPWKEKKAHKRFKNTLAEMITKFYPCVYTSYKIWTIFTR